MLFETTVALAVTAVTVFRSRTVLVIWLSRHFVLWAQTFDDLLICLISAPGVITHFGTSKMFNSKSRRLTSVGPHTTYEIRIF